MSSLTKEGYTSQSSIPERIEGREEEEKMKDTSLKPRSIGAPSTTSQHLDNDSKQDTVNSIKNNNEHKILKKDKIDDTESGKA